MKQILLMIAVMALAGCGKEEQADTNESTPTTNTNKVHGTTAKPVKELTLEEKVVGTYEGKIDGYAVRLALLDNGVLEPYDGAWKSWSTFFSAKWKIVDGDIHLPNASTTGSTGVLIIDKDGSLTTIARIGKDGKRRDNPKEDQMTFKRIK